MLENRRTSARYPPATQYAIPGEAALVFDHEQLFRVLVIEVLASRLKILHSNARIDLLVTDVGLPGGMNGRQWADSIQVLRPELENLFITEYAENAVINYGQRKIGMQIMTKLFSMEALGKRIREMIKS